MPPHTPQSDVIPLPQAINKYFDLSIYLLVLMGLGTLASTGVLDWPAIALVGSALALRGYLLAERRRIVFSERWTTPLTVLYFIFYSGDYFLLSRSFLTATVHLVLFAVVVRTFSLRRDRDYTTLAILAFLMVLASAVLTVDSVFLVFFAAFTLLAVATFVLMEMRRSGKAAAFQARHSHDEQEHRHLAFSLMRTTPALVLMILVGGAGVFFLLPRMSASYLGAYSFGTDLSTGFSDRVQLGRIGQIQQSGAVVMHVHIDGDQHGRYALHWRGVSLWKFDGRNWSNPHTAYPLQRQADGGFSIPLFTQGVAAPAIQRMRTTSDDSNLIHYRVLMEPIGTNVFFLAPWARRVSGAYRALQVDVGGAVSEMDSQRSVSIYDAESDISRPSAAELRQAGESVPQFASAYLQLPDGLDARIPRLSAQATASASNNYDKAAALERYLQTHYGYTLQLLQLPVADPLANFLFERKQGHCEYFASSMAVMLRTLHIPSRVVNGFRSEEFNDLTGNYVVRARNAHSWVEAYFPGYGWVTFDPTPGGAVGSPQGWARAMLYLDAAASFWREWVVSYDSTHQYMLGQTVMSGTRSSWEGMRTWAQRHYRQLLNLARKGQRGVENSPERWFGTAVAAALLLLLLVNGPRIARIMRAGRLRAHPERSPDEAAVLWYEKMSRFLAQRGLRKSASQTAQEFVRVIEDGRLRTPVEQFTEAYESARFGNSADHALRLPELYEEVEAATEK